MTLSLASGFLWLIAANIIAMFPSRDHHWRNAYRLIQHRRADFGLDHL